MLSILLLALVGSSLAQFNPNMLRDRAGIVQLFEWDWRTIADECEQFLGPKKWGAVQISPPTENRLVKDSPWWERYQPVSYKLTTRSGHKTDLMEMVKRCNRVGVRTYADVVINHMCGIDAGEGHGFDGSYYNTADKTFRGVPYSYLDFNSKKECPSSSGNIEDYRNAIQVRNCRLSGLLDLNQGKDYVRQKLIAYLNELIDLGVAGFRIDAAKHMWPGDLKLILPLLKDLPTSLGFPANTRPFIYQQVIDLGSEGEAVKAKEYYALGRITEFKYPNELVKNRNKIQYLKTFGESWNMMPSRQAVVFLNNHDTQRYGGSSVMTYKTPFDMKIFTAFMMAHSYGVPRVMSSYYFENKDIGRPSTQRIVKPDGTCGNGWVCEHRWREIRNLATFAAVAKDQPLENWFTAENQIAFSRGNKAFIAINKATTVLRQRLQTGLPAGKYCNIYLGEVKNNMCTGPCVTVDSTGQALIEIHPSENPVVALHVNAQVPLTSTCGTVPQPTVLCKECSSCTTDVVDCGYYGIDQLTCEGKGCLWCPNDHTKTQPRNSRPFCVARTADVKLMCSSQDTVKEDCGKVGITEMQCGNKGCCWKKLTGGSTTPWCFYPTR